MSGVHAVAVAQAIVNVERRKRLPPVKAIIGHAEPAHSAAPPYPTDLKTFAVSDACDRSDAPAYLLVGAGACASMFIFMVGAVDVVRTIIGWVASW
jgi:hypothetical protein